MKTRTRCGIPALTTVEERLLRVPGLSQSDMHDLRDLALLLRSRPALAALARLVDRRRKWPMRERQAST